ncbi:EamA family transporter RarD [Nocardioides jiangxiensis]|uniref:EamA family transporter RarD n=1 Tax=Nocardioides jiangxiensis TaxID=3064524 RepID=A0ABT9B2U2_9ACTN|nr:EamA family transporter RarD [Nocardioides sp. WY-20]MDO7868634.1 EamA family transporter RarD [Nocardioides sp. WY-20]
MSEQRRGFLLGAAAYGIWGLFPLYFPLLEPAGALEILTHRVLWSALTMALVILVLRRWNAVQALVADRRRLRWLGVAAVVVACNWGGYIWGVNHGHVVETSLGYFINPLVTVLLGVTVLGERLRGLQWAALGLSLVAAVVLTLDYGRPPWVALVLAVSFGLYGLAKKQAAAGAVESLTLETAFLAPLALAYVIGLAAAGDSTFASEGPGHAALMASSGVVTAVPLVLFGAAATRMPLVVLGLLQYLAPIIQFTLGLLVFDEAMPLGRWIGFGLVWSALTLLTVESLLHHRRQQLVRSAEAAAV